MARPYGLHHLRWLPTSATVVWRHRSHFRPGHGYPGWRVARGEGFLGSFVHLRLPAHVVCLPATEGDALHRIPDTGRHRRKRSHSELPPRAERQHEGGKIANAHDGILLDKTQESGARPRGDVDAGACHLPPYLSPNRTPAISCHELKASHGGKPVPTRPRTRSRVVSRAPSICGFTQLLHSTARVRHMATETRSPFRCVDPIHRSERKSETEPAARGSSPKCGCLPSALQLPGGTGVAR